MAKVLVRRTAEEKLVNRMNKAGFPLVSRKPLLDRPMGKILYQGHELIFNRGLNKKKSSFGVIATKEDDGSLMVHYYDPDPDGVMLKREEFLRKVRIPADASWRFVESVVGQIKQTSLKKDDNEFFFSPHNHFGAFSPPYVDRKGKVVKHELVPYDDGVSYLTDNIRKAVFYHIDYYALTSHNSFSKNKYRFLSWAAQNFGFNAVPGIEFTGPLNEPNGPHFVVWMRSMRVADRVKRAIIKPSTRHKMPSFFDGMHMDRMLGILHAMQEVEDLALGIAHPVNYNSPDLPIPLVGLYSAVDAGKLTLEQAHEYARRFDSVSMWNTSLYNRPREMWTKTIELDDYFTSLNKKHFNNRRLFVNQTNYALAKELQEKFGLYTHFETDEHKTLPFRKHRRDGGYVLGGDSLAMGATVIKVPAKFIKENNRKPRVGELIEMIRRRAVQMEGRVFAELRKNGLMMSRERARIPRRLVRLSKRYDLAVATRYVGMLVKNFFNFISGGEFEKVIGMPGE